MGVTGKMTSQTNKQGAMQISPCKSFTKTVIYPGSGWVRPNEGSVCAVLINQLTLLDEALIGYPLRDETEICLGDGEGVMSYIIDTCLEMMLPGETCQVEVAIETMREIIKSMPSTPNDMEIDSELFLQQPVVFQIELKSFIRDKEVHEMTVDDKLDRASKFKTKGSICFSCGNLQKAEMFYLRALKYMITIDPLKVAEVSDATIKKLNTLKCACLLNIAACKLKYKCYEHTVAHCTKALAIDAKNAKGLFRRGIAYMELQEYEAAKSDFDEAIRLEPMSKPLKQQRLILQERMKTLDAKYAKAMRKMFGGQ